MVPSEESESIAIRSESYSVDSVGPVCANHFRYLAYFGNIPAPNGPLITGEYALRCVESSRNCDKRGREAEPRETTEERVVWTLERVPRATTYSFRTNIRSCPNYCSGIHGRPQIRRVRLLNYVAGKSSTTLYGPNCITNR